MGKHESIKGEPVAPSSAEAATLPAPPASDPDVSPKMALAGIDKIDASKIEAPKVEVPKIETSAIETPKIEMVATDEPKIELWTIESPHIAPDIDDLNLADAAPEPPPAERVAPHVSRFTLLAASLALAAALGGMVGAFATASLVRPGPAPATAAGRTGLEEFQALKEQVVQARVELAAMKVSIDAGNRGANTQFTRIGERIERVERTQAEPAAKLSKALDSLERLVRADAALQSRDITRAIMPPPVAGAPIVPGRPPGAVDGWVVRDVRRGTAFIEGRMGIIEVDQGDVVPGLGRVEAIRRQDGRWVVVTSKGLVMSPR